MSLATILISVGSLAVVSIIVSLLISFHNFMRHVDLELDYDIMKYRNMEQLAEFTLQN